MTDKEILEKASENNEQLIQTEWVGTNGLIWTWQDTSNVMDTRSTTYKTKRAALDGYAEYLRYTDALAG